MTVFENCSKRSHTYITKRKHILDLKISGGIGGGGAVNGGAVLGNGGGGMGDCNRLTGEGALHTSPNKLAGLWTSNLT